MQTRKVILYTVNHVYFIIFNIDLILNIIKSLSNTLGSTTPSVTTTTTPGRSRRVYSSLHDYDLLQFYHIDISLTENITYSFIGCKKEGARCRRGQCCDGLECERGRCQEIPGKNLIFKSKDSFLFFLHSNRDSSYYIKPFY